MNKMSFTSHRISWMVMKMIQVMEASNTDHVDRTERDVGR